MTFLLRSLDLLRCMMGVVEFSQIVGDSCGSSGERAAKSLGYKGFSSEMKPARSSSEEFSSALFMYARVA